jgi:integrase
VRLAPHPVVRRNILERFRAEHGHLLLKGLQRVHIATMMGAKASTPEAANNLLKVLRVVLAHGVDVGMIASNPALGVKRYRNRSEGNPSWTEIEIAQFQATHAIDTRAGLALALPLYTGQRRSDVVRMGWQHVKGNLIMVRQQKTGRALAIPMHPELARALAAAPKTNMTFLLTEFGKPFTAAGFGNWFRRMCNAAGLPHCSAHGLRHAAGRRLADAECTQHEIAATLGMSLRMVARYTQAASQEHLAERALSRQLKAEAENEMRPNLPNIETHVYPKARKL